MLVRQGIHLDLLRAMLRMTLTVVVQVILRQLLQTLDLQSFVLVILYSCAVLTELLMVLFWQVV